MPCEAAAKVERAAKAKATANFIGEWMMDLDGIRPLAVLSVDHCFWSDPLCLYMHSP